MDRVVQVAHVRDREALAELVEQNRQPGDLKVPGDARGDRLLEERIGGWPVAGKRSACLSSERCQPPLAFGFPILLREVQSQRVGRPVAPVDVDEVDVGVDGLHKSYLSHKC